jgi:hypothetical protein
MEFGRVDNMDEVEVEASCSLSEHDSPAEVLCVQVHDTAQ